MKIVRRGALPGRRRHRPRQDAHDRARRASFASPPQPGKRGARATCSTASPRGAEHRRRRRHRAAEGRARRRQRHGRHDAGAGAAAAADHGHPVLHGARRHVPAPPAEPAAGGEPRVHHREGARRGRRPRHRLGRRRRPLLLRRRRGRVRARRLHHRAAGRGGAERSIPARRSSTTCVPRRAVPDTVERCGGRAVRSRVGHAFIKLRMREENALFAGEVSGHYYFRDFYGVDTGIVPALVLLELISRQGGSLAELSGRCASSYHISGEINTPVRDVPLKLQELKDRFGAGAEVVAPRRRLDRLPRLALQRPPVEHRAAAAPEPRGVHRGRHGAPARRGARAHQRVSTQRLERSGSPCVRWRSPCDEPRKRVHGVSVTDRSRRSASRRPCGSGSTRPTPRASSTTAATCRTSTARGSSTCATSACCTRRPPTASS